MGGVERNSEISGSNELSPGISFAFYHFCRRPTLKNRGGLNQRGFWKLCRRIKRHGKLDKSDTNYTLFSIVLESVIEGYFWGDEERPCFITLLRWFTCWYTRYYFASTIIIIAFPTRNNKVLIKIKFKYFCFMIIQFYFIIHCWRVNRNCICIF